MIKRHEFKKRITKNQINILKNVSIEIALKQINIKTLNLGNGTRTLDLTLGPINLNNKAMMKL